MNQVPVNQNVSKFNDTNKYANNRDNIATACYRTSNNKFFNAPPRMADGRNFTDYRDSYVVNNLIISDNSNDVSNSYDYRMFLTQNADQLMRRNWEQAYLKNGVFNCKEPFNQGTMLQEQIVQSCDAHRCNFTENYAEGVGLGRVDIKDNTGNTCVAPLNAPELLLKDNACMTDQDATNVYGNRNRNNTVQRVAVPGAGNMGQGGDPNVYN